MAGKSGTSAKAGVAVALLILGIAGGLGIIAGVHRLLDQPNLSDVPSLSSRPPSYLEYRQIDTRSRLWLNGYLALFFRFQFVGYWSWLALPLLLVFCAGLKKRAPWEIALVTAYILAAGLIGVLGYFNYRYACTLIPFTAAFILVFGRDTLAGFHRALRIGAYAFLVVLTAWNIHQSSSFLFSASWRALLSYLPQETLRDIRELELAPGETILEHNAPEVYYYTDKKVLHYNPPISLLGNPGILTEQGFDDVFQEAAGPPSAEKVAGAFEILKKRYGLRYVLVNNLPDYCRAFNEFLRYGATLVKSERTYALYRMNDKFIHPEFEIRDQRWQVALKTDFSGWRGPDTISAADLSRAIPPLVVVGVRGQFQVTRVPDLEGPILRVTPLNPDPKEGYVLILGYFKGRNGFSLPLTPGQDVIFEAEVNVSSIVSGPHQLIIQDKTDRWESEVTLMDRPGWSRYFGRRTIRDNSKEVVIGLAWRPSNKRESLELRRLSLYIRSGAPPGY